MKSIRILFMLLLMTSLSASAFNQKVDTIVVSHDNYQTLQVIVTIDNTDSEALWIWYDSPSGGNVGTDVFYFSEDSQCCYNCPLIKKNEKIIGIALFQLNGRLMVYSVYDTSLAFFMAI